MTADKPNALSATYLPNTDAPARASWSKPLEFILSCIGYAVGIGNVWRFPYLCYRNGGGAFLVAYLIMVVLMGMPIFLLELIIGQYSGLGPDQAFSRIAPIFSGLGYCTLVVIFFVTINYMVIIAWTVFYFCASFTSQLGWGFCNNDFNSMGCYSATEDEKCSSNATFYNFECTAVQKLCQDNGYSGNVNRTFCLASNGSEVHLSKIVKRTLASQEYYNDYMLGIGGATWENFGSIRWELVLCLLLSWIIAYGCVMKGVKTSGKAVYFTALFPYIILTALVVRGVTLDGAWEGIKVYIVPKWEKLLEVEVWGYAASQTFYSFGISCGSLVTLASYNDFKNNCVKDVLIVSAANIFTSIYAGFAIFSMLGFLAKQLDVPVEDVATDGPGLAFIAYPEALLRLPLSQLWAVLFFFMLFILGIGCQFAAVEALCTTILDKWPYVRRHHWKVTLSICFVCFVLAIPMCFEGGIYIFTLMDWNTASWAILLIGFAEVISVAWLYKCNRFLNNVQDMSIPLSKISRWFWWTCWVVITPLVCLGVFAFQMANFSSPRYEDYTFPEWADALGILIGVSTLAPFPAFAAYSFFTSSYVTCDSTTDVPERASWSKPVEFVLSCIGYAVGIGNVWRFPYLCYRNGGGAFLVAYLIMVIVMGLPIFLLELVIGQYSGLGPDQAFSRIAPIFSGLGYCTLVVILLVTINYMVIIAWTVFYFFASCTSKLGWAFCNNDFNSKGCYSAIEDEKCGVNETFYNYGCTSVKNLCQENGYVSNVNRTYCLANNSSEVHLSKIITRTLASQEYYNDYVLGIGDATWENFGTARWELIMCLLLAWIIAYGCVMKGVKTSGKAVYFTALFPYVILTALVVRGVTLDGAWNGIKIYILPKWEKLLEVEVWGYAASQTFYSFGTGCGSLITLASYNDFRNNCFKDAVIVTAANIFTSVYAGFAIFSMLGFLAKQLDMPVEYVATDGPGLAFVAYPEALLRLPLSQLWAILFFFMLFNLGLGSQFAAVEALSTTILDKWPYMRRHHWKITLSICFACFILALPMCFQGGIYIFTLMDWNTASWAVLLIGFAEVVSVSWAYGSNRILNNIQDMSIHLWRISQWFWWICWVFITPLACLGVFVFQMVTFSSTRYEDYIFPMWANVIGILIGLTTLAPFPIFVMYTCFTKSYSGKQWFETTDDWGPQSTSSDSVQNLNSDVNTHSEKETFKQIVLSS